MVAALVQMLSHKGALSENVAATEKYLQEAEKLALGVIAFPEASITGYVNPFKFPEAVLTLAGAEAAGLLEATRACRAAVLAGIIEHNPKGRPFVTQLVICQGQLVGYARKRAWFFNSPPPVFTAARPAATGAPALTGGGKSAMPSSRSMPASITSGSWLRRTPGAPRMKISPEAHTSSHRTAAAVSTARTGRQGCAMRKSILSGARQARFLRSSARHSLYKLTASYYTITAAKHR